MGCKSDQFMMMTIIHEMHYIPIFLFQWIVNKVLIPSLAVDVGTIANRDAILIFFRYTIFSVWYLGVPIWLPPRTLLMALWHIHMYISVFRTGSQSSVFHNKIEGILKKIVQPVESVHISILIKAKCYLFSALLTNEMW